MSRNRQLVNLKHTEQLKVAHGFLSYLEEHQQFPVERDELQLLFFAFRAKDETTTQTKLSYAQTLFLLQQESHLSVTGNKIFWKLAEPNEEGEDEDIYLDTADYTHNSSSISSSSSSSDSKDDQTVMSNVSSSTSSTLLNFPFQFYPQPFDIQHPVSFVPTFDIGHTSSTSTAMQVVQPYDPTASSSTGSIQIPSNPTFQVFLPGSSSSSAFSFQFSPGEMVPTAQFPFPTTISESNFNFMFPPSGTTTTQSSNLPSNMFPLLTQPNLLQLTHTPVPLLTAPTSTTGEQKQTQQQQ